MSTRRICVIVCTVFCAILSLACLLETTLYVEDRNTRLLYTDTTCAVINFTCIEQTCQSCQGSHGVLCIRTDYPCWGEYYSVSYSISNGTKVTSTAGSGWQLECKPQRKVRHLRIYRIFIL